MWNSVLALLLRCCEDVLLEMSVRQLTCLASLYTEEVLVRNVGSGSDFEPQIPPVCKRETI